MSEYGRYVQPRYGTDMVYRSPTVHPTGSPRRGAAGRIPWWRRRLPNRRRNWLILKAHRSHCLWSCPQSCPQNLRARQSENSLCCGQSAGSHRSKKQGFCAASEYGDRPTERRQGEEGQEEAAAAGRRSLPRDVTLRPHAHWRGGGGLLL
jgi:hypothetical protein